MGRVFWVFTGLCFAAAIHLAYTLFAPGLLFQRKLAQLSNGQAFNSFFVMAPEAQVKLLPGATPKDIVGLCLFDLDRGKVVLTAQVPRSLWTLSIYGQSGAQVYEINDVQAGAATFTIALSRAKSLMQQLLSRQSNEERDQIENVGWHAEINDRRGVAVLWVPVPNELERKAMNQAISGTTCAVK